MKPLPSDGEPGDLKEPGAKDGATPTSAAVESVQPADSSPAAPPALDDAAVAGTRLVRSLMEARLDSALEAAVVDVKVAKAVALADGIELGVDDDGRPVFATKDGTERPLTHAALSEAGFPDFLLRPLGRAGSGLTGEGGAWREPDYLTEGLRSQEFFEKNEKKVLEALVRSRGKK
jgi:hypothetical protein